MQNFVQGLTFSSYSCSFSATVVLLFLLLQSEDIHIGLNPPTYLENTEVHATHPRIAHDNTKPWMMRLIISADLKQVNLVWSSVFKDPPASILISILLFLLFFKSHRHQVVVYQAEKIPFRDAHYTWLHDSESTSHLYRSSTHSTHMQRF